ncbi:orange carotenoid protein N-terminal domain-containing protein [Gloeobacter violaceus]|uniref:Glr0050 protein n=1 Tax=Gloeobacter violaceus (strain ATCC 29082 / PCC 7421) TaxID=251221 RepID=Q7NPK5_GLOVI|nr:orange carotenoid protein N-terminal domain-containing protein [Gloeobacter violaceus]BAC87991.1 glr0050 [Gloeobacter violaceus PCC 7421]
MAFTLESAQAIFAETGKPSPIPGILADFNRLSLEDRLALLWYAYTETGRTITRAALGAASMALVEGMLDQIKQMPPAEQTRVMFDLARRADTPISRSYGYFSVNTKLGFWYQLAEWMAQGTVAPIPANYQMSTDAQLLFESIKNLDGGQQIQVLRDIVLNMGFDPSVVPDEAPEAEDFQFERTEPVSTERIDVKGVDDPTPLRYFEAMNSDNFEAAVALFEPEGALQPPFQKPIVGREAIAAYMREEAQGLTMKPIEGITEVLPDGSKKLKVTGKVQTPWFGVNVAMNIAWRFALNPKGEIFFVAIDMLASPEELVNLRPPSYR